MKIKKHIFTLMLCAGLVNLFGSCPGEYLSITELLNHDPKNHHIFICEVLTTFVRAGNYESIAVVKTRFRGNSKDTIFLNTGGGTTAGGQKLYPNSEWLIFSTTDDELHYRATVCDHLSVKLKAGNQSECERDISGLGKIYLEVLEEYESISKKEYSGYKEIVVDERMIAKGHFKYGLPTGDWIHYSRRNEFGERVKRSEICYKDGMLHGKCNIYEENEDQNKIIEKRIYEFDWLILINRNNLYEKRYEYKNDKERIITSTFFNSSGSKLKQFSRVSLDYKNERYDEISFRNGYYYNKLSRDSSEDSPIAEGNYYRGTRVGEWRFFNKQGELISSKVYPQISGKEGRFLVYDEQGRITVSGIYIDGKRIGKWKYFNGGYLEYEEAYDTFGQRISKTRYFTSGGMAFTPYLENKKHGLKTIFKKDNTIKGIENYERGRLNGISIFFDDGGTIVEESKFIDGREFTVRNNDNSSYVSNSFLNGHFVMYHSKTKKKMYEGDYWNGYRTGIWIEYDDNGSYTKMYYPTDKEMLVNQCGHATPGLTEQFDREGNLINSWKF